MLIFTKIEELKAHLSALRSQGKSIGFVPTMGALHAGHMSLIQRAAGECDTTVSSIFVNPTQFNDKNDLARYPRTPEKDIQMLEKAGCHVLFMPSENEMYPEKDARTFDFGHVDKVLEGAHRPGHFNGVAQIVSKLFDCVQPQKAYFGEKDYQQVMVIKAMVRQLNYPVEVVSCPIIREADGLAMSSRNALLSPEERKAAAIIPQLIKEAETLKKAGKDIPYLKSELLKKLSGDPIYRPEYIAFCNADTLEEVNSFQDAGKTVILIACFVGKIRLIDNSPMS